MPVALALPRAIRPVAAVVAVLVLGLGVADAQAGPAEPAAPDQAGPAEPAAPDQAAAQVLAAVRAQLGDPYAWAGNGPDAWDCSGLTSLWRTVGGASGLPRVSREQQAWTVPLPREQALPGDLVFFGEPVSHVGVLTGEDRMIDAAASKGVVVERAVWTTGVVRYGRVPRRGMPAVRAWTPPSPVPAASATPAVRQPPGAARTTSPAARPPAVRPPAVPPPAAGAPARPAPVPSAPAPGVSPSTGTPLVPLAGLPARQARASSPLALRAAARARAQQGVTTWDDVSLVRDAWRRAGGAVLPADREALVRRGRTVRLADARVGDLVVYNRPATHLGVYLGAGTMVDASARAGRVVVRSVYTTPSVRLVRLG